MDIRSGFDRITEFLPRPGRALGLVGGETVLTLLFLHVVGLVLDRRDAVTVG
jgi:hypothetical protein